MPNSSFLSSWIEGMFFKEAKKKDPPKAYRRIRPSWVKEWVLVRTGPKRRIITKMIETNISCTVNTVL